MENRPFSNIPVTLQNMDIITNQGKMLTILEGSQTVSVTIRAPRSVFDEINVSNIIATADISQMELYSLVPITVTVPGFEGRIQSAVASPTNLQVDIEDVDRRTFPIVVNVIGQPTDGYVIGETYTTPDTLAISGPESLVNSIARVEARVRVGGVTSSQSLPAELAIIDEAGDQISMTLFPGVLEEDTVYVNIEILETKLVPIALGAIEDIPEGYILTYTSLEPRYILVAGSLRDLNNLTEIIITADAFDLDDDVGIHEFPVDVRPHLPEGIILVDEHANLIVVSIAIEQEGTRTFELPVDTISILGLADNLTATFDTNGTIAISVLGEQRVLDRLDLRNYVSIDLTQFTDPGTPNVIVNVELPSGVRQLGRVTVRVILEEVEDEEEDID
jgi:YbbR domain-containing protein